MVFQLTASQGGWHTVLFWDTLQNFISTHSLTRRLTICWAGKQRTPAYFNSQPHKEADTSSTRDTQKQVISTHSLTRRLTRRNTRKGVGINISTHSLTRRLTSSKTLQGILDCYFNSQPHKEADGINDIYRIQNRIFQLTASQGGWRIFTAVLVVSLNISTHSLTRRLTNPIGQLVYDFCISTHSLTRRLT